MPLLQQIIPAVSQGSLPADMGKALLTVAVKGFKYARPLEDMIEGLNDNMQQLEGLQQQVQQTNDQAMQMDQQYQQQLAEMQGYIQQLEKQLGDVDMAEQQRDDIETQAEAAKDMAEVKKKEAETAQIWQGLQMNNVVGNNPYQV